MTFFRLRLGKALNDIGEIESVTALEHLSVEAVQMDSAYLDPLGNQLRISDLHVESVKRDKVRLAVGFFAFEALDTHAAPERIDDHLVGMELSAYDRFAMIIDDILGYRRGDTKYQSKEEHYY